MTQKFLVSVITPVYNAEQFVRAAVESAVHLEEVGEIILIEDGSPDNALAICQELETEYSKVTLLQHPNGANRGAGASRNLGIKKSKLPYIAFLDADDLYKENRFEYDKAIFIQNINVDGVFHNSETLMGHKSYFDMQAIEFLTKTNCDSLLWHFFKGDFRVSTNSITLKKSLIVKTGYFNESLKLHQDTHLWLKVFQLGKIFPGSIKDSVSLTREHEQRRIKNRDVQSRNIFLEAILNDFLKFKDVDKRVMKALIHRYLYNKSKSQYPLMFINTLKLVIKHPHLLKFIIQ